MSKSKPDVGSVGRPPRPISRRSLASALSIVPFILLATFACNPSDGSGGYPHETLEAWKERRMESLRQNWVSLAGLYWLEEGENTLGSDPSNDIVFPERAPQRIGRLTLREERLYLEPTTDAGLTVGDRPFGAGRIESDRDGDATLIKMDPFEWYIIERDGRYGVRLYDRAAGRALDEEDIPYYPVDPAWRIRGTFERHDPPLSVPVPTVLGTITNMTSPGRAVFDIDGETFQLDVLTGGESTYFVMFADPTNRNQTYEAGRYLYIDHEDEHGNVVLDFNRSYNPPCAFTPYATCPFPPPQNRLGVDVTAGEMRYRKDPGLEAVVGG